MNKEYTYINGKVVISDENDKKTQREYCDNIDEVLVQENIIETIEKKIQELEGESASYKKYNRNHYIHFIFPMITLISTIGAPLITNWYMGSDSSDVLTDSIFGSISQTMAISFPISICIISLSAAIEIFMYYDHKSSIKQEDGINCELAFLKQQIEKERENLEKLKQDKSRDNENTEFRTVKVDDLQQLRILREYLNLYFDLGYNGERYYQYYQQGILERKLQNYYDDTEIQMAKEYFQEKGPSLVLRKKHPNNSGNSPK